MPRPAPSFFKKTIWRLEVLAYDVLRLILGLFPFAGISAFGGWLVRKIGPLTSKHHIAKTGLSLAFPDLSETEMAQLLTQQWDNTGRTLAEFPLLHRIQVFAPKSRVKVIGVEKLKRYNPSIIVTGHFANWEVMAAVLTQSGLPVRITYRKIDNPYMDARIRSQREKYGTKLLVQKSTHKGGRQLFQALRSDESIALLNDQKFNEGLALPFFGHDAMTAPGAVRLALKTGRPILPISVTRDRANFTVTIHDPLTLDTEGTRDEAVEKGVLQILKFTEEIIRKNPDQWFWVHRRWPKPLYKKT